MVFAKLKKQFPSIRRKESLKNHSTFRVGGYADYFYELKNIEELPSLVGLAEENALAYKIMGRGTNILFTDKGFKGLLIKNVSADYSVNGNVISCNSGVLLAQLIRISADNGLHGLEPLAGVPGTLGGAIYGNAGVPEVEIGDFIVNVTVFDLSDGIREIPKSKIKFSYRHSSLQDDNQLILQAKLKLSKNKKENGNDIKKILSIRRNKQPYGNSAGCIFKNPSADKPAGRLIDLAGLKGLRIGDAEISPVHGNFILNRGNATSSEILQLAEIAQDKVKEKFGIKLDMEVKIVGDL